MSINIVRSAKGGKKALRRLKRIEGKLDTMSKVTDQIAAGIVVIGNDITTYVTGSKKTISDQQTTIDAQAAQITLLTSEDADDKAAAAAAQQSLANLKATSDASAAQTEQDEASALAAVEGLKTVADALNAPPQDTTAPPVTGSTPDPSVGGAASGDGTTTDPTSTGNSSPVTTTPPTDASGSTSSDAGVSI